MTENKGKSGNIQTLAVATQLLELLAEAGRAVGVTELAARVSMTKARVSRHLSTLAELGLVAKANDSRGYRLGPKLFGLAQRAIEQFEITSVAYPFMVEFRDRTREAMLLAVPSGNDAMVVATLLSLNTVSPHLSRGARLRAPVSPTARLLLAFQTDDRIGRAVGQLAYPDGTTPAKLKEQLGNIQARYYDWEADPHLAGFCVISVPVFNHTESLEAALSVVMQPRGDNDKPDAEILGQLLQSAAHISQALGSVKMAQVLLDQTVSGRAA